MTYNIEGPQEQPGLPSDTGQGQRETVCEHWQPYRTP